jgi:hypothetical protein
LFRRKVTWRAKGSAWVDPALWDDFRKPLLTPEGLGAMFPEVSERKIRCDLERCRWRFAQLGDRIRKVGLLDVAMELEGRAGKRPVRHSGAGDADAAANP